MIIPYGLENPSKELIASLKIFGINVAGTLENYDGIYTFSITPNEHLRAYRRQHSEDLIHTYITYNDIEIFVSAYKCSFHDRRAYFTLHNIMIAGGLIKSPIWFEPNNKAPKTPLQEKMTHILAYLYSIITSDSAYGGHAADAEHRLKTLRELKHQSIQEHDQLLYSNDYYIFLYKIFPGWKDPTNKLKEIQKRSISGPSYNPTQMLWAAITVFGPLHQNKWRLPKEIPININEYDYDYNFTPFPQDSFSLISVKEIKDIISKAIQDPIQFCEIEKAVITKNGLTYDKLGFLQWMEYKKTDPLTNVAIVPETDVRPNKKIIELSILAQRADATVDDFREAFKCPLSHTYFVKPVVDQNGVTFSDVAARIKILQENPNSVAQIEMYPNLLLQEILNAISEKNNSLERQKQLIEEKNKSQAQQQNAAKLRGGFFNSNEPITKVPDTVNIEAVLLNTYKVIPTKEVNLDLEKAFRRAAASGNLLHMKIFIERLHININSREEDGSKRTALHWVLIRANDVQFSAIRNNYLDCLMFLIKENADLSLKDDQEKTPVDYDFQKDIERCISLLTRESKIDKPSLRPF